MGDHRATIKLYMSIHGKIYEHEMWINYWPDNDGVDNRIKEFFSGAWDDALARYKAQIYELDREDREKRERKKELEELARLKAKYEPEAT